MSEPVPIWISAGNVRKLQLRKDRRGRASGALILRFLPNTLPAFWPPAGIHGENLTISTGLQRIASGHRRGVPQDPERLSGHGFCRRRRFAPERRRNSGLPESRRALTANANPETAYAPFDCRREGFVPSEKAGRFCCSNPGTCPEKRRNNSGEVWIREFNGRIQYDRSASGWHTG